MTTTTRTFSVSINARPEDVFAYVSDLTRHGEWNEGLRIEAVTSGSPGVGSQYRSWGKPGHFLNEIKITAYQPPTRFAFVASQAGFSDFQHEFVVRPQNGGTVMERIVTGKRPLLARLILWPLFGRPAMTKSLAALKAKLEHPAA
jgi:uncharacterized protein YndB with AHSA1/START domain